MKIIIVAVVLLVTGCQHVASFANISESSLRFQGPLTQATVDVFIDSANGMGTPINEIVITSSGGDVEAGIRLGTWIARRKLDVTVEDYCLSSCANYIFTAGKIKTMRDRAIVAWHGSVEQQNLVAQIVQFDTLNDRPVNELDDDARSFLEINRQRIAHMKRVRVLQREYFALIYVDERVTRVGQEMDGIYLGFWTITPASMSRFGLCNVHVPAGYGGSSYMEGRKYQRAPIRTLTDQAIAALEMSAASVCVAESENEKQK